MTLQDLTLSLYVLKDYRHVVDLLFERIKNNLLKTQHLTQLRDWLLPMLMNGQVAVK